MKGPCVSRAGLLSCTKSKLSSLAVLLGVEFGCLTCVVGCLMLMPLRCVGVVGGLFVIAFLVVPSGFAVVAGGVLMMLRRMVMMLRCFLAHVRLLFRDLVSESR